MFGRVIVSFVASVVATCFTLICLFHFRHIIHSFVLVTSRIIFTTFTEIIDVLICMHLLQVHSVPSSFIVVTKRNSIRVLRWKTRWSTYSIQGTYALMLISVILLRPIIVLQRSRFDIYYWLYWDILYIVIFHNLMRFWQWLLPFLLSRLQIAVGAFARLIWSSKRTFLNFDKIAQFL